MFAPVTRSQGHVLQPETNEVQDVAVVHAIAGQVRFFHMRAESQVTPGEQRRYFRSFGHQGSVVESSETRCHDGGRDGNVVARRRHCGSQAFGREQRSPRAGLAQAPYSWG